MKLIGAGLPRTGTLSQKPGSFFYRELVERIASSTAPSTPYSATGAPKRRSPERPERKRAGRSAGSLASVREVLR